MVQKSQGQPPVGCMKPCTIMGYLIFPISTGDRIPDLLNQQYHHGENYGEDTKYIHIFNHGENGGTLPRVDYEGYHPNNTTIFSMMGGGFKNNKVKKSQITRSSSQNNQGTYPQITSYRWVVSFFFSLTPILGRWVDTTSWGERIPLTLRLRNSRARGYKNDLNNQI